MKKITVKKGQSIFDIALQEYGDITGLDQIVRDNNIQHIDNDFVEGKEIYVREELIVNKKMVEQLKANPPATKYTA